MFSSVTARVSGDVVRTVRGPRTRHNLVHCASFQRFVRAFKVLPNSYLVICLIRQQKFSSGETREVLYDADDAELGGFSIIRVSFKILSVTCWMAAEWLRYSLAI